MYVVLSVIILFSLWMLQALGQKVMGPAPTGKPLSVNDQLRRRMELREEMHRRIRDKLINGIGSDEDLFQGMDEMMGDAFVSTNFMGSPSPKFDWVETKTGRSLVIIPDDPSQKIDLDVKDNMINIKGETKVKSENSESVSQFENSFPIPQDCDGSKVKIRNEKGNIVMDFPFKGKSPTPVQKDTRVPLPPRGDEVPI